MSDVERLARVLYEAFCRSERIVAKWDNESAGTRGHWAGTAREAIAAGVTLSAPVAPRPTPLQAASAAVHAELMDRFGGAKLLYTRLDTDGIARAVLAAAVGALPGGPQPDECSIGSGMERQLVLRAALLAALTEGGEG